MVRIEVKLNSIHSNWTRSATKVVTFVVAALRPQTGGALEGGEQEEEDENHERRHEGDAHQLRAEIKNSVLGPYGYKA